jgi:hypothetical protein
MKKFELMYCLVDWSWELDVSVADRDNRYDTLRIDIHAVFSSPLYIRGRAIAVNPEGVCD